MRFCSLLRTDGSVRTGEVITLIGVIDSRRTRTLGDEIGVKTLVRTTGDTIVRIGVEITRTGDDTIRIGDDIMRIGDVVIRNGDAVIRTGDVTNRVRGYE